MTNQYNIPYLLQRYCDGAITIDERRELTNLVNRSASDDAIQAALEEFIAASQHLPAYGEDHWEQRAAAVLATDKTPEKRSEPASSPAASVAHRVQFLRTAWFRYAAGIILLFGTGAYLWKANKKNDRAVISEHKQLKTSVEPGKVGAILTLADGTQIVLDSVRDGVVTTQNGIQIVIKDGLLAYDPTNSSSHAVSYNIMTTPKGRNYQVALPDGSKVWLNAASSLKFPTAFTGAERVVEIEGEAYFEVAKDKTKPFKVKVKNAEIAVLGTSFNVNSYEGEEAMKTTLIDGVVIVNAYNQLKELKPGQQAQVAPASANSQEIEVQSADLDQVLAWKNGLFNFNKADLPAIMRQLARWYDIEVKYEGEIPKREFQGEFQKELDLSDVLSALQEMGVRYKLDDRVLTITDN